MEELLHVGLDIGSTTVKIVILDKDLNIIYSNYERHFSDTKTTLYNVLTKLVKDYPNSSFTMSLTGSGRSCSRRSRSPWSYGRCTGQGRQDRDLLWERRCQGRQN